MGADSLWHFNLVTIASSLPTAPTGTHSWCWKSWASWTKIGLMSFRDIHNTLNCMRANASFNACAACRHCSNTFGHPLQACLLTSTSENPLRRMSVRMPTKSDSKGAQSRRLVMRTRICLMLALLVLVATRRARGADGQSAEYLRKQIPNEIAGQYSNGELIKLTVGGRNAYLVRPKGTVDPKRRWIWIFPFWLGISDGHGALHHHLYVERFLGAGFHVAGIDVGTSCGSPSAARLCQEFDKRLTSEFHLNGKARLVVQSNGGLIGYAWAFRHPDKVDRIFGICPVTDFRTWPTLPTVITAPAPGLGYDLTLEELTRRTIEFNPVDNLAPLAKAGVKILHIHGDKDELVPLRENSSAPIARYKALGGDAALVTLKGLGHGGKEFYESREGIDFLLGK
jgi:hypothetical protein